MKKMALSLIATLMVSSIGFSNTIELKEVEGLTQNVSTTNTQDNEEILRICYEKSRVTTEVYSGFYVTTITYMCFNHNEIPGNGTVYINASVN